MKKIFLSLLIIIGAAMIVNLAVAQTKTSSSTVKPKATVKPAAAAIKPKALVKPITASSTVAVKPKIEVKPATTTPAVKPKAEAVKPKTETKPAATVKPKAAAPTGKYGTTLNWDASGLKYLSNFAAFDYSATIRKAVIKKIENYARRNNIKVITAKMINGMRE